MDVCCVLPVSFYIQAALTTFPILADRGITERCNSLPKFLNFHSFFWRIGQKVAWRLIPCALAPRSEKSSIRHCNWLGNNFICQCYTKDRSENTSDYRSPHFAGQEPNWMFNLYRVEFASSAPANHVDVTFVPSEGPIRFHRDLLFSDAPDPGFDVCWEFPQRRSYQSTKRETKTNFLHWKEILCRLCNFPFQIQHNRLTWYKGRKC